MVSDRYSLKIASPRNEPTRRRNAGSITGKSPLIITGGAARNDAFHYQFTEKRRFTATPKAGSVELTTNKVVAKRDIATKLKFKLPRNFCPDCNRTDRLHTKGAINVFSLEEGVPAWDIQPGDCVVSFWCQECQENDLLGKQIIIPGMDDENVDKWRKRMIRQNRMDENIRAYIQERLVANDFGIVVDERSREVFGAI